MAIPAKPWHEPLRRKVIYLTEHARFHLSHLLRLSRDRIAIPLLVLASAALGIFLWWFMPPSALSDAFAAATAAYRAGRYDEAYGIMHPLAKAGDASAQFNLAFLYAWGRGVPNDRGKVLNWYRCAAEQGDSEAQLRTGIILLGQAVEQSLAERHNPDDSPLQSEALYWLQRAAEQDNPEAQYDLGRRLLHHDAKAALAWFERAAKRDHDMAQFELGEIYRQGKGAPAGANQAAAFKWYLLAARRGNSPAQAKVGEFLYAGTGTPQDPVKAYEWLTLAGAQPARHPGIDEYNKRLTAVRELAAAQLTPQQISAAQRSAAKWHPARSTANSVVEWREKPAMRRAEKEPSPPSAYPHCEL